MLTVNMYPVVLLTKEILQSFKKRWAAKKQRSLICNTSAMMSHGATHTGQTYAATKIFVDFVTHGLGYELAEFGVDVCAWRAAGVKTNLLKSIDSKATLNVGTTTPENYVKHAFSKCTSGVNHGWTNHEILGLVID